MRVEFHSPDALTVPYRYVLAFKARLDNYRKNKYALGVSLIMFLVKSDTNYTIKTKHKKVFTGYV